ncbi:NAD-dependent epimerase/dehydratase family protein [Puniceicoccales bacterium CK1056]|uniref:NAD-dependent epimerase/dehydratase family protein n=1 Tax=Oceanipulchritudo coccoides TaxID=2706888 RepID=A0A6B2M5E3_9BACT|nr:NAD-dependent epimerase/dehydratase family protein [Oceanipulchritudo coccoides]NDV63025.1 NAD-dependent epimerase/dehydratase family protein [Oceanipulchritudo coccoides]
MEKGKRILITGCNGFVGTNLYRAFEGDFALSGVDLPGNGAYPPDQVFSWEDVAAMRVPPVDAVIHLAGKAHDTSNAADPESYFRINLGLTQAIFDWFLKSDSKHFIFFSSVKAVADTVTGDELTEEAEPDPKTPYGQSKLAAEEYVRGNTLAEAEPSLKARLMGSEKIITILRPCMIHGPGNKGNLNELYGIVSRGVPWPLGAFENRRTFVSIDNMIHVLRRLVESGGPVGTYQVADDEAVSTNDIVRLIAESVGRKPRIWGLPPSCVRAMARVGDVLHLPLNSERLKKLTESYVASNTKLKEALGIEQMPVRAEDGLRKTLSSFRNE